ncbi:MAG: hypothetical protein Q7U28_00075 [Aquabacterium sp.]|nr:hypothetical protein [Aquabacterium sp.]
MNYLKKLLQILLVVIAATQLAACSKTVQWEEEVPLNTGETIWVKRSVVYKLKGAGGNPFDIGYGQDKTETLSFNWGGKKYVYEGEAALMLLAISPQKQPVLVAPAANKGWDWNHNYYCATPHYVQFVPDPSGSEWSWPPEIESWLYDMPSNLMRQRRKPADMQKRYTAKQRAEEDAVSSMQSPTTAKIDPKFIMNPRECKRRN